MEKINCVEKYWTREIIKCAKDQNLKYAVLWASKFFNKLMNENDLISVALIKQEMPKFYQTMMSK